MVKGYFVNVPPHLSDLLANLGGVSEQAEFQTIIDAGRTALFNFTYPIPAEDKTAFENWLCNHYIMRRIGSGNIRKWRQMFKAKLLDIMPYYNDLMESTHMEYDPLINHDIETTDDYHGTSDTESTNHETNGYQYTRSGNENGTGSLTEQTNNIEVNRYSDTPQGDSSRIWEINAQGQPVLTDIYLTDIRGISNDGHRTQSTQNSKTYSESGNDLRNINGNGTVGNENEHTNLNNKTGLAGVSRSKLVMEYRETFLRIYQMIAEEMDEVFYNLVEIEDILDYPPDE